MYNGLEYSQFCPSKRNLLLLGMEGVSPHLLSKLKPGSQALRDSVRVLRLEDKWNVVTCSRWQWRETLCGWNRHLPTNLDKPQFPIKLHAVFGNISFSEIIIDYFRAPDSWAEANWKLRFDSLISLLAPSGRLLLSNFRSGSMSKKLPSRGLVVRPIAGV
jgi:hypothetical protein